VAGRMFWFASSILNITQTADQRTLILDLLVYISLPFTLLALLFSYFRARARAPRHPRPPPRGTSRAIAPRVIDAQRDAALPTGRTRALYRGPNSSCVPRSLPLWTVLTQ
jgi:hypothetical protein